jgi:lipoprotein|nr:MAG TPA: lipoprotein [Caudoviricetes sp.]
MKKELIALAIATAVMSAGCGASATTSTEATTAAEATAATSNVDIVSKAKEILPDALTPGIEISSVELKDRNLYIAANLNNYSGQFALEAVAEAGVTEISDALLSLDDEYYSTWDTMTIDFGDQGHVTFDKSTVKDDGAGKYFSYDGSILQK